MREHQLGPRQTELDLVHYLVYYAGMEFNVHEAKTHFSKLLAKVEAGEEVIIARAGKPVAKIVPIQQKKARRLGTAKGQFAVPDDFNDPLPKDLEDSFYE